MSLERKADRLGADGGDIRQLQISYLESETSRLKVKLLELSQQS